MINFGQESTASGSKMPSIGWILSFSIHNFNRGWSFSIFPIWRNWVSWTSKHLFCDEVILESSTSVSSQYGWKNKYLIEVIIFDISSKFRLTQTDLRQGLENEFWVCPTAILSIDWMNSFSAIVWTRFDNLGAATGDHFAWNVVPYWQTVPWHQMLDFPVEHVAKWII